MTHLAPMNWVSMQMMVMMILMAFFIMIWWIFAPQYKTSKNSPFSNTLKNKKPNMIKAMMKSIFIIKPVMKQTKKPKSRKKK